MVRPGRLTLGSATERPSGAGLALAVVAVLAAGPGAAAPSRGAGPCEGASRPAPPAAMLDGLAPQGEGPASAVPAEAFRLAGLDLAAGEGATDAARSVWAEWRARPDLGWSSAGPADRWGRVPVFVRSRGELLNAVLLRAGLARVRTGDVALACARALLAEEDAARRAGLGLWAEPNAVIEATRPADIKAREGRMTLVEGRVVGIGETRTRVYLNFGTVRSEDFTVSIQKRNLRKFEASGMRWTSWEGRRIRVRGVVVPAGGPLIELSAPEDVERLD